MSSSASTIPSVINGTLSTPIAAVPAKRCKKAKNAKAVNKSDEKKCIPESTAAAKSPKNATMEDCIGKTVSNSTDSFNSTTAQTPSTNMALSLPASSKLGKKSASFSSISSAAEGSGTAKANTNGAKATKSLAARTLTEAEQKAMKAAARCDARCLAERRVHCRDMAKWGRQMLTLVVDNTPRRVAQSNQQF